MSYKTPRVTGSAPLAETYGADSVSIALTGLVPVANGGLNSSGITGIVAGTGSAYNGRTITGTANQISVTNGDGSAGNPTLALTSTIQVSGISFDSGSNTLSNYVQGTFSPTIEGATTAGTGTYTTQVGRYTRIGNRVSVTCRVTTTAHTGTGQIRAANFPFTFVNVASSMPAFSIAAIGQTAPASTTYLSLTGNPNTTNATLNGFIATTGGATAPAIQAAMDMIYNGVYEI